MTRRIVILSIVLIFASEFLRSQDMWDVYRQFLPAGVDTSATLRTQIVTILQAKGEVHPDLLYFYLSYYSVALTDSAQSHGIARSDWPRFLAAVERLYLKRRSDYMSAQRQILDTMETEPEVRARLSSLFSVNGISTTPDPLLPIHMSPIDSTVMNYLALRFVDRSDASTFDPHLDYRSLRHRAETHAVAQLSGTPESGKGALGAVDVERLDALSRSWYLFESRGFDLRPPLALIGCRILMKAGASGPISRFGISVVLAPIDYLFRFEYEAPLQGAPHTLDLSQQLHGTSIGLSVDYKWFLRQYFGVLSYLDLRLLGILMVTRPEMTLSSGYDTYSAEGNYLTHMSLTLNNGHLSSSSRFALLTRVSTPLVVLFGRHPVELALHVGVTRIAYNLEYSYRYVHQWLNPDGTNHYYAWYDTQTPPDQGTETQWQVVVSPSINVVIQANEWLAFDFSFGIRESYVSFDFDIQ